MIMKNILKAFMLLFIATTVLTACSKDDDPADNDLFVGTYTGSISYYQGGEESEAITNSEGTVRVVKVGDNYNFIFSDDIPDLTGVEFRRDGDNAVISIGDDVTKVIRIDEDELDIGYTKDNQYWTANCSR